MQQLMKVVAVSALKTNKVIDRSGQQQSIESFDIVLTNGLDSVVCETSRNVTNLLKEQMVEVGTYLNCSIKLRTVQDKNDKTKYYMFGTLLEFAV